MSTAPPLVKPYREITPDGRLRVNMHWGQQLAWDSNAKEILMLAGTGGGKTSFCADWLHREIQRRGPGDYMAVTAAFPLLNLRLLPEFLDLFQHILHLGAYRDSDKLFEFRAEKTRLFFGTATNPESLESARAKAAVADEAGQRQFRRQSREALLRRLNVERGRILYPSTPYGLGWLKTELYDRRREVDLTSDIEVVSFPSTANPVFPREEFERARRTLPPWKFRMFYEGKFDRPVGLIYDCFSEVSHKIGRFPIPKEWPVYVGHDFGAVNTAAVFLAQNPTTGELIIWETYKPGEARSIQRHVEEWKKITEGRHVVRRVGGSHQEEEIRQGYQAHGWQILEPQVKEVLPGILRVYEFHKQNKILVFTDLYDYLEEKLSYSWALNDKYEPTDEIEDKASFHLMDAERYLLSDFRPDTVKALSRKPVAIRSW